MRWLPLKLKAIDKWVWSVRKRFWVFLAVFPVLIAGILFSLLSLAFWEPSSVRSGSLAYLLAIPSAAKNFPVWKLCGAASYGHKMQDGPAPETYWIEYQTQLSKTGIEELIQDYVRSHNCKFLRNPQSLALGINVSFTCAPSSTEIQVLASDARSGPACQALTITFVEDLN